jgi:hypothetical protein
MRISALQLFSQSKIQSKYLPTSTDQQSSMLRATPTSSEEETTHTAVEKAVLLKLWKVSRRKAISALDLLTLSSILDIYID